jgi:hypothetical protein
MDIIQRYLDGDTTLCKEIQENKEIGKAKSYSNFMDEALSDAKKKMEKALEEIPKTAYIYATYSDAFPGLVKIGRSRNVKARISSGNTFSAPAPQCVICMAATFNAERDEKAAHEFFRQFRREGEFFEISHQEVENYFNAIIKKQYQAEQKQFFQNSKAGDSSLIKVIESNATSNSVVSEACHAVLVNDPSPGGICKDSALDDITIKYQNEDRALDISKHKIKLDMMESKARFEDESRQLKIQRETLEMQKNTLEMQKNALEMQKNALEMQKNTLEMQKNALEMQKNTLEMQKNALEMQKNALEMQKNALEMQKNALELITLKYSTCQASLQAVAADILIHSKTKVFMTDQIKNDMLDSSSNLTNQTRLINPGIAHFFSAKVNSGSLDKISAFDLYSQYSAFYTKGNYKCIKTNTFFGREVARIDGTQKVKKKHAAIYYFDGEKIKIHLIKSNEYDPEVLLED